ncbi:oxygenase MpaB family protein [Rhodocista pekingensis]|uniref:Oxygenase MpaB family protein n=1 Tax=Rhodocista pekingensis TaxID=201185 RepID=A0ABW2KTC6_9PROT
MDGGRTGPILAGKPFPRETMPPDHPPPSGPDPGPVTATDLEALLRAAAAEGPGDPAGLFDPDGALWQVDREALLFLGAGRALLLQLAHPWVAAGVAAHSVALDDPLGRFHRTFGIVFAMVFGSVAQAEAAARRLHRRHAAVTGRLPDAAGPFAAGSPYRANDPAALAWVHATLADTALLVHDLVLPPLPAERRALYWREQRRLARLFGIRAEDLPPDWAAFQAGCRAAWDGPLLTVTPEARHVADSLFRGRRPWLRMPGWFLDVTALLLPERLRDGFGLVLGERERRRAERALDWVRRSYPRLPDRLRFVAPYHEARARLDGRPAPDLGTRTLNRVWIGRERL